MIQRSIHRIRYGLVFLLLLCLGTPLMSSSIALAQAEEPRLISITASGSVWVTPDMATISVGIETTGTTARQAGEENNRLTERVLAVLQENEVAPEDVKTGTLSLQPVYEDYERRSPGETPKVVGYRVMHQLTIQVTKLSAVTGLLDAIIGAGATHVYGVEFTVANPERAYHQALRLALREANAQAMTLADELGVTLKGPKHIRVNSLASRGARLLGAGAKAAEALAAAPAVMPGEMQITASVSVDYEY